VVNRSSLLLGVLVNKLPLYTALMCSAPVGHVLVRTNESVDCCANVQYVYRTVAVHESSLSAPSFTK